MTAKWTFMVYMAGNNSLSGAAATDLREMQKVGSSDALQVMAFAKQASGPARHIHVGKGGQDHVEELPQGTDSGDPQTVVNFVRWAAKRAPAERYALVLWNHGGGWSPDDFDELYQHVRGARAKAESNRLVTRRLSRTLFKTSIARVFELAGPQERAICSDDGTGHSLDTIEVDRILASATKDLGKPLELFGMDACLMSTLEVAYQVRKHARTVVGSEELEPNAGWCYDAILRELATSPDMDGQALGKAVVSRYVASYEKRPGEWPVTHCAVDTAQVDAFSKTLDRLVAALREALPGGWSDILKAQGRATSFECDMVDLRTFCRALVDGGAPADVKAAAAAVVQALAPGQYVLAEGHLGDEVKDCGGVSIYLPAPVGARVSKYYRDLSFAKQHAWDGFLTRYLAAVRQ